ncbi:MAG TPA: hypothetical protein PLZ51_19885, partial [Aggregatilineales bacterium]|nr:hypothetical protein [Aggregatilineales bacterium]
HLVSLDTQSIFRLWNILTSEEIAVIREHSYTDGIMPHISPDGQKIAIDILDGTIILWDTLTFSQRVITWDDKLSDGELIGGMYTLGFSPDGRTFLAVYWFPRENSMQDTHPNIMVAYDTTTWQVRHHIHLISFDIY